MKILAFQIDSIGRRQAAFHLNESAEKNPIQDRWDISSAFIAAFFSKVQGESISWASEQQSKKKASNNKKYRHANPLLKDFCDLCYFNAIFQWNNPLCRWTMLV